MVKRTSKLIICISIVIILLLQCSETVLGKIEDHSQGKTGVFGIEQLHVSKHLDGTDYITGGFGYRVDGKNIYRIYYSNNNQKDYETTILCLDKSARFPMTTDAGGTQNLGNYTSLGEATASTIAQVKRSVDSVGASRITWLINNAILPEDSDDFEKQRIAEIFDPIISSTATDVNPVRVEDIRAVLTEDDLVIALQLALWQITNDVVPGNISGTTDGTTFDSLTGNSRFSPKGIKGTYIKYLYNYYASHWDDGTVPGGTNPVVSVPADDNTVITVDPVSVYAYVGPFKIDSATNYYTVDISFQDDNDQEVTGVDYLLTDKADGTGSVLVANKESLDGKQFYVRIRANSICNKVTVKTTPRMQLDYSKGYVWKTDKDGDQPILTIDRKEIEPDFSKKTIKFTVNTRPRNYDASLRKSIVGVLKYLPDWGDYSITGIDSNNSRIPRVALALNKDRQYNQFTYEHRKDPFKVEVGSQVVYQIRVYNEGDEPMYVTEITDNLPPSGLRMPTAQEEAAYAINQRYGWTYDASTNSASTQYDNGVLLRKKEGSNLAYRDVRICLVVTEEAKGKIVTNIAEITNYETSPSGFADADSGCTPKTENGDNADLPDSDSEWQAYDGKQNGSIYFDLNAWFKGQEDDDDFEKIEVPGDTQIDLALRKSIYEVSGTSHQREVKPNTTPLDNGTDTTSVFTDKKDPITVQVGDKVKYRIRVFNEGNQDGYASRIEDYLPKGLGFVPDHVVNIENGWNVTSSEGETTLGEVANATSNFKASELRQGVDVNSARVVKGKATINTRKLENDKLVNYEDNGKQLDIHSVEVVCVVLDEVEPETIIKNIAAITEYKNEEKQVVTPDRDSDTTNRINPDSYPANDHIQDDDDYEQLKYNKDVYDLALQKFITKVYDQDGHEKTLPESQRRSLEVNTDSLKNRVGTERATADYRLNKTKVDVENGDTVLYTIRVFNEGRTDAIVSSIIDTVPTGLAYITDSQVNRDNGWTVFDQSSNSGFKKGITTDKLKNEVIPAFDNSQANGTNKIKGLSYRDVQVEFKVVLDDLDEDTLNDIRTNGMINRAEIMSDDGDDNDSTPNNATGEDDLDYDVVIPPGERPEFDLALKKFIVSINNGQAVQNRFRSVNSDNLANGGQDATYDLDKSVVKVKSGQRIVYTIRVFNEADVDGYVKELRDTLPSGLRFIEKADSQINNTYNWQERDGQVYTDYLKDTVIKAYDPSNRVTDESRQIIDGISYKDVQIELMMTSKDPSTVIKNEAEITDDSDEDRDSTPKNNNPSEDDQDYDNVIPLVYDLALKKSVASVTTATGTVKVLPDEEKRSIEVVSTDTLINRGQKADAEYRLNKTPVGISNGDIVVYTIRVFNEGEDDAKVLELVDSIPEGLEFVEYETNSDGTYKSGSKINCKYNWKVRPDNGSGRLYGVTSDYLKDTVIPKFDTSKADGTNKVKGLSYQDVQIELRVNLDKLTDNAYEQVLKNGMKNLAEITEDNGDDTDSEPDDNIPTEDDEDYDIVIPHEFDLALRKFITKIDDKEITTRIPQLSLEGETIKYTHPKDSIVVVRGQTVIYTLRVYNEGTQAGYAAEITDDLPEGITFLPENSVNKKYKWKMIDASGNETTDVSKAVKITTDYLSKDQENKAGDNLIEGFDRSKGITANNPSYKEVQVAFKVTKEDPTSNPKVIKNTAEISKDTDDKGNEVEDKDSIPGNGDDEEDDIDIENIELRYFDLSLLKYVSEVIVTENGNEKSIVTNYTGKENPEPIVKIEIDSGKKDSTQIRYIYTIKITNEGDIEGYAKEITDRIPDGLAFNEQDNTEYRWKAKGDGIITTDYLQDKLIKPGQSEEVKLVLRWIPGNYKQMVNVAEITKDENEYGVNDVDSTPNNNKDGEDDQDNAIVLLMTNTGAKPIHLTLIITVLSILGTGMYLIRRYVL